MISALVIGRANGVWQEVNEAVLKFGPFYQTIAINSAGCDCIIPFGHWVSFHADLFPLWITKRKALGKSVEGITFWTNSHGRKRTSVEKELDVRQVFWTDGGSSGMIAVRVALGLGAERVVLAGVPLDPERGHYNMPGQWDEALIHRKAWEKCLIELAPTVRSMSGWTREKFGEPTQAWIESTNGVER